MNTGWSFVSKSLTLVSVSIRSGCLSIIMFFSTVKRNGEHMEHAAPS